MSTRRKQAAEWLVRLENPNVSAGELLQWEAWMNQSAAHRRSFAEVARLSRRMNDYRDGLKDLPVISRRECDEHAGGGAAEARSWSWPGPVLGRAWNRLQEQPAWARRTAALACASTVLISVAFLIGFGLRGPGDTASMQSYRTATAEHRSIVMPDGSAISMGGKSSLTVHLSSEQRLVMLESGEALFRVAEDERRPFVVVAGAGSITALGTLFNVRRDGDRAVVTVTEGRVEVNRGTQTARGGSPHGPPPLTATITAGTQAIVSYKELSVVELRDTAAVIEWQQGRSQYRAEALKYVVAGVNRYSAKEIIITDTEVENMLFTGSVFQDQTDDWLAALEAVFPVEVTMAGDNKVLIRKRLGEQDPG